MSVDRGKTGSGRCTVKMTRMTPKRKSLELLAKKVLSFVGSAVPLRLVDAML